MTIIFSVLGSPPSEELDFITDEKALEYIKSFPKTKKINL
jgi:mitogen-activated protein kinase 1/3